jgi:GntR family transcriptional regulator
MEWLFDNNAPIYSQLIDRIKLGIVSGELPPGARLPSVRDMATEAGVNPNTMQRALQELEREALVFSQRTSGRFVTEDENVINAEKKAFADTQVAHFLDSMSSLGFTPQEILALLEIKVMEVSKDGGIGM